MEVDAADVKEEGKETGEDGGGSTEEKAETKVTSLSDLPPERQAQQSTIEKLTMILSGEKTIFVHLLLKQTKDAVRVSICHTATVIANGFMHTGTTHDSFLRDNLDWLGRATNWAKLSAIASLGVIHRGHEKDSLALMQTYLPKDSAGSGTGYAEGGGLYAL